MGFDTLEINLVYQTSNTDMEILAGTIGMPAEP